MTATHEDESVEIFGPYEVYERLGVGGMASVHRAKKRGREGFERVVALKRLLSHLAEDRSFIQSFVREARLASQLQHSNIIQIYDLDRVDGVYYIAMEFVRGRDLRKMLKQTAYATGPMPVPMMLTLARQLCDALDHAHSLLDESGEPLGIVHRDISPSNLLIAADGNLKVIDFGIAKATASSLRTQSGRVKGKFAYMAPEAISGIPLDHRSDIFSVGIVCHEMLTARPLFASKNEYDTLQKIAHEPVEPPSQQNPDCPAELDEIVLTALAKSPDERWQTAGAMQRALDHVARKHGLLATPREIAEWVVWAFEQPLQRKRVRHKGLRARLRNRFRSDDEITGKRPALRSSTGPIDVGALDKANIEIVWGSNGEGGEAVPGAITQADPPTLTPDASSTTPMRVSSIEAQISAEGADRPGRRATSRSPDAPTDPWPQGTPRTEDRPATSSYRVTMLGLAPPPEVEALRARHATRGSSRDPEPPPRQGPAPITERPRTRRPSQSPPEDLERTIQDERRESERIPAQEHPPAGSPDPHRVLRPPPGPTPARTRQPSAGPPTTLTDERLLSGRLPLEGPPPSDPSIDLRALDASTGDALDTTPLPARGAHPQPRLPATDIVPPPHLERAEFFHDLHDEPAEMVIPKSRFIRVIQVVLIGALCVGAAVLGYFLVPDGPGVDDAAGAEDAAAPIDAGAPTPVLNAAPIDAAPRAVIAFKDGEIPIVPGDRLVRASGPVLKARRAELNDDGGRPVVIEAQLCIDGEGKVTDVELTSSPRSLRKRARRILRKWRYQPFELGGRVTPVCFDVSVTPRPR